MLGFMHPVLIPAEFLQESTFKFALLSSYFFLSSAERTTKEEMYKYLFSVQNTRHFFMYCLLPYP